MRQNYRIWLKLVTWVVLSLGTGTVAAHAKDGSTPPGGSSQQCQGPAGQEPIKGYPVRERRIGGPTDIEWDLDNSFPKQGSLLELILKGSETRDDCQPKDKYRQP
jgi:hypothetical protein